MLLGTSNLLVFLTPVWLSLNVLSSFYLVPVFSMVSKGYSLRHRERPAVWCYKRLCACSTNTFTASPGRHVAPFMCQQSPWSSSFHFAEPLKFIMTLWCFPPSFLANCYCAYRFHLMDQGLWVSLCKTLLIQQLPGLRQQFKDELLAVQIYSSPIAQCY